MAQTLYAAILRVSKSKVNVN